MKHYGWPLVFITLILVISLIIADKEMSENQSKKLYELPQDCDFMEVRNNASISFACSPRLTDQFSSTFEGLLINGPKEVVWPKNVSLDDSVTTPFGGTSGPLRLMIAGLSHVPDSTLELDGDVAYKVLLIAVNEKTAKSYSGRMQYHGVREPKIKEGLPAIPGEIESNKTAEPMDSRDYVRKSYFNIDLVHSLQLPVTDATYTVYATLGDYKSNVLTIKTAVK